MTSSIAAVSTKKVIMALATKKNNKKSLLIVLQRGEDGFVFKTETKGHAYNN